MGGDTESRLAALQPQASSSRSTVKSDINVVFFVLFFLSSFPFRSWILNKSLSDDIRLPKKFDLDDATMILSYRAPCSVLLSVIYVFHLFICDAISIYVFPSKTTGGVLATSEQEIFCINVSAKTSTCSFCLHRSAVCLI